MTRERFLRTAAAVRPSCSATTAVGMPSIAVRQNDCQLVHSNSLRTCSKLRWTSSLNCAASDGSSSGTADSSGRSATDCRAVLPPTAWGWWDFLRKRSRTLFRVIVHNQARNAPLAPRGSYFPSDEATDANTSCMQSAESCESSPQRRHQWATSGA